MDRVIELLNQSKRPVLIAGGGIRLAHAVEEFQQLVEKLEIPVVAPLMGVDLLQWDNPFYMGHGGTKGQRSANMVIQQSDLIISIGSRLCISFIGHNPAQFAPQAKKIVVDIDPKEHSKKTIDIDLFIESDAKVFIKGLLKKKYIPVNYQWMFDCRKIKENYFTFLGSHIYTLINKISELSHENDVFTTGSGVTAFATAQGLKMKRGQRLIIPGTLTMGYGLPASIGIWAAGAKSIVAIVGDGSLQLNIQELQTIVHYKVPVKIFVVNNGGYLAIRTTQKNNFGRLIGEGKMSGVSFPDTKKIAKAYGITYYRNNILKAMKHKGPVICELFTPYWQPHLTVAFGKPNDQMNPPI